MNITEAYQKIKQEQLEEGRIANAIGAAAIAGGALFGVHQINKSNETPVQKSQVESPKEDPQKKKLLDTVLSKFKHVDPEKASHIVDMAIKYSKPVFPTAHHLLALVGNESSFNDRAKSSVGAVGLLQVRPNIWNISPHELSTVEGQMKHGSHILSLYHDKLGDIDSAVKSYNVGITNFRRGRQREAANRYLDKFKKETSRYEL